MKIILSFLFTVQLCIMSAYGILLFRGHSIHNLLMDDIIAITLNFNDSIEDYELFLNLASEKELDVSRVIFLDEDHIIFYTTDLTLDGLVTLKSGRFPHLYLESNEFVSTLETEEASQVGIINSIIPSFNIVVGSIANPQNFSLDGVYFLHTSDLDIAHQFVSELEMIISFAEVSYYTEASPNFLMRGLEGFSTPMQFFEFVFTSFFMFLVMISSSVQFAIGKLKVSSIFLLHGFSLPKITKVTVLNMLQPLLIGSAIAYIIILLYSQYMDYGTFRIQISVAFIILTLIFISIYTLVASIITLLFLTGRNVVGLIKGRKHYILTQVFNHGLKVLFTSFFLLTVYSAATTFNEMQQRLDNLNYWNLARNIYQIDVTDVGQVRDDFALEREFSIREVSFYEEMSQLYNGFIMCSVNISHLDEGIDTYHDMSLAPPAEIDPFGHRITISPNYLNLNPIETSNEIVIEEQLIFNEYVLNILVPDRLNVYEEEIFLLYIQEFYEQKVLVSNLYNRELHLPLDEISLEDLDINIIYVKDQQYYFSFDAYLRPETASRILDPIAVIYTGNFDPSFLSAKLTNSFYFETDAINAYDEISHVINNHGLESAIVRVRSVFDQNRDIIIELQEQFARLIGFTIILIIAHVTVTYNLVANYFEQNKYKLTIKQNFGFSFINRNRLFIFTFIGYSFIIILLMNIVLGFTMLFIGLTFLIFDVMLIFSFEMRLQKKSYAKILKGEH